MDLYLVISLPQTIIQPNNEKKISTEDHPIIFLTNIPKLSGSSKPKKT